MNSIILPDGKAIEITPPPSYIVMAAGVGIGAAPIIPMVARWDNVPPLSLEEQQEYYARQEQELESWARSLRPELR